MGEKPQNPIFYWSPKGEVNFQKADVFVESNLDFDLPTNEENTFQKGQEFSLSFDIKLSKKDSKKMRKLFKFRLPRKFKKKYKNMMAKRLGMKPRKLKYDFSRVRMYEHN